MIRRHNVLCRVFALIAVLITLPLLLFYGQKKSEQKNESPPHHYPSYIQYSIDIPLSAVTLEKDDLSSKVISLSCHKQSKNKTLFNFSDYLPSNTKHLLCLASFICVLSYIATEGISLSRRYIIKYIQDQDGHKGFSFNV